MAAPLKRILLLSACAALASLEVRAEVQCPRPQTKFGSYGSSARNAMWSLYPHGGREIYCSAEFMPKARVTAKDRLSINVEHVVPQARLHSAKAAGGDLHNLWPSIELVNSARGSLPLVDDIPGEKYYFSGHNKRELATCDFEVENRRGRGMAEPSPEAKGRLARAALHILLAYPKISSTRAEIEQYLAWHKRYPVADDERMRNEKIDKHTRVRNPFIDSPEQARKIVDTCYTNS